MKTFRISRACEPARLHAELLSAGVPVISVRAGGVPGDVQGLAVCAVVVTDDSTPGNTADIIAAHVEGRAPKPLLAGANINRSLTEMEKL